MKSLIAKLKSLFVSTPTEVSVSSTDGSDVSKLNTKDIFELEINETIASWITDLGHEGLFKPLVDSSPAKKFMVIDLDLLRGIKCDCDYSELSLLITSNSDVSAEQLDTLSYLSLSWEW